ncbi:MAG: T9SS type A sorting domain-containing protein [Candidatus Marinimicrobia bacterium]|nr:T9SS type A sorting domain-containing protein [Candidatus Neomarinimicrobiota bacterium]
MKKPNLIKIIILWVSLTSLILAQNNMLEFAGDNDYVTIGSFSLNEFTGLTIEAWVYAHTFNPYDPDFNISNVAGHDDASGLLRIGDSYLANDRPQFVITTTSGIVKCDATTQISPNTWYHIAGTYDGSNLRIYVNGVLEDTDANTGTVVAPTSIINLGGSTSDRYFDGMMDEVRIWNDARSEAEIRANMYLQLAGTETGLSAYYNSNATTGSSLADNSTNSFTGTLTNMTGGEWTTSPAFYGPQNALTFNSSNNDYVAIASTFGLGGTSVSGECWVNLPSTSEMGTFINVGGASVGYAIGVGTGNFDVLGNDLIIIYDLVRWIDTGVAIGTGWHHVAYTIDASGRLTGFIDGVIVYSESGDPIDPIAPSGSSYIGSATNPSTRRLSNGTIEEVRLWSDIRAESEIRENMCKTLTGNEAGLVAYYNFDNGTGIKLTNIAGATATDGTIYGDPSWVASTAFNTWLNTDDATWSTATNWSRGSEPGSSDNVGIINYSGGTAPTLSGSPTINHLVVDDAFTVSSGLTVNGNLILENDLDLNGQTITLEFSATLIESNGYITGSTGQIQTTRALSNISAEDVAGLGAAITTSANMGSTTIIRGHEAQGPQGINRYYQINPSTNTGLNATLVFNYHDAEITGFTESALELFKSSDGSTWTEQFSSTVSTSSNTLTLTGIDAFSYWTAAPTGSDASLPVELSIWTAVSKSSWVNLQWTTESEIENLGFIIDRKLSTQSSFEDLASFSDLESLKGQGSTSRSNEYSYLDKDVRVGQEYTYRLSDVDYHGKRTNHAELSVIVKAADETMLIDSYTLLPAYPNPFNPSTTLRYGLPEEVAVSLFIYDIKGNLVKTFTSETKAAGWYEHTWNGIDDSGQPVSTGLYLTRLQAGSYTKTIKMLYLK